MFYVSLALPLVGASNVGRFACRCDPLTQTMFVFRSGGRLCTLIGVPWRVVGFSTLSTGRFVLKQQACRGAESAEHADTAGYTYEGTQTTA